ncbi:MAG TPA: diguanylate cyclase [Methyloceanibacter sp.]|jgi:diguanylate cyclase (GGDEF)-like protein|nr:diguanylate cyclase [Methyloceanibacter sp.]
MRIALVDPSRTTRLIVARMLEAGGHEVVPFADDRDALIQIKADHSIDALITSAELKHMSGVELCWETRLLATSRRPIYVLMMSSQYDHRNLIEALDSGADDFIGKPPLAEELYARLRAAERIASMQRELIRLATIDPLTGLCNRRGFFKQATEACARVVAPDGSVSAIILDIDNFKCINDSYGHETGDEAIRACAEAARMQKDLTGRLGGDEFALILEQRTLPQAIEVAEDLRSRLAQRPFHTGKERITLTWSIGVGEGQPGDTVDQILARADAALYDAKLKGRNCVVGINAGLPMRNAVVTEGIVRARAMA